MPSSIAYVVIYLAVKCAEIHGMIDVNLRELEYLAARLDPFECRRLIAALHYTTYDLPQNLAAAERKVDEEISCLRQLLHWNEHPAEGRGKTHAAIVHRLRQLRRDDLADWLGKTAFKQLGQDLNNVIVSSPEMPSVDDETGTTHFATAKPTTREEDLWLPFDTILLAFVLGLLGTLFVLIVAVIVHTIKNNKR